MTARSPTRTVPAVRANQTVVACVNAGVSSQADERASDDALLRRVAAGDRAAFEQVYARHAPWLAVRLGRRCRDDELAADLLQETFLAVWRFAGSYSGTEQVGGWLWTIASRRLIDAHRRSAVRVRTVGEPRDEHAATVSARSAEDEALRDVYDGRMAVALDLLSPELRAVLQATVLDGYSTRETAVLLGLPEGTVKTRAMRARRAMREALA